MSFTPISYRQTHIPQHCNFYFGFCFRIINVKAVIIIRIGVLLLLPVWWEIGACEYGREGYSCLFTLSLERESFCSSAVFTLGEQHVRQWHCSAFMYYSRVYLRLSFYHGKAEYLHLSLKLE